MQRPWLGYVSLFLIIAILAGFWIYSENLIASVDRQAAEIVRLREQVQENDEMLKILRAPEIEVIVLRGVSSDSVYGKILRDPRSTTAILHVSHLAPTAEDREYRLWAIRKKKYESAGVFEVRDEKERGDRFAVVGSDTTHWKDVEGFVVTLEAKGGTSQPMGPAVLRGNSD